MNVKKSAVLSARNLSLTKGGYQEKTGIPRRFSATASSAHSVATGLMTRSPTRMDDILVLIRRVRHRPFEESSQFAAFDR